MKTLLINTQPTPDSPPTDLTINLDRVDFVFKPPMEPFLISMPGATFQVVEIDVTKLTEAGLVEFDTPEGTKGYANPKTCIGWVSPQLGSFVIVFPGSRMGVKATTEELERKMGVTPALDLGF